MQKTPLHVAAEKGDTEALKTLLDAKAEVDARTEDQWTPLHLAAIHGGTEAIKLLLDAKAEVNARTNQSVTPLHMAASRGHTKAVETLLDAKADVNTRGADQLTPLHYAALGDHADAIKTLVNGNAEVDAQDTRQWTPLHIAAGRGHTKAIKALLDAKAEVDARDGDRWTPLHNAAIRGHTNAIKALLDGKAEVKARNDDLWTPLDLATKNRHTGPARTLRRAEANIDVRKDKSKPHDLVERGSQSMAVMPSLNSSKPLRPTHQIADTARRSGDQNQISASLETAAFLSASHGCQEHFSEEGTFHHSLAPSNLINIRTGRVARDKGKFVIASYICYPERVTENPFEGLLSKQSNRVVDDLATFRSRVRRVCEAFPEYVTTAEGEDEGINEIKLPITMAPGINEDYQREVYLLAAREAHRRGLNHVWMDCLCIDQTDDSDKARTIPQLARYYTQAECCVAVSEVLRRRICLDPSDMDLGFRWQLGDDLLSWIVGLHYRRSWLFQETFLAKEIVTRGGDVRINTSQFLGKYYEHFRSKGHLSSDLCDDPSHRHFKEVIMRFPTQVVQTEDGQELSIDHRLERVRHRSSTIPQDRVYSALALFSPVVSLAMPIDYRLPISAIYAILVYLRICDSDSNGLLTLRLAGEEKHQISQAPSWIPSGRGTIFQDGNGLPLVMPKPPWRTIGYFLRHIEWPGVFVLDMAYLPVIGVEVVTTTLPPGPSINHNILLTFGVDKETPLSASYEGAIEPLEYAPSEQEGYEQGGYKQDANDYIAGFGELETAVREDRAVAVLLGEQIRTNENSGLPKIWAWLILCTANGGKTWIRKGVARTDEKAIRVPMKEKRFRIM